MLLMNNKGTGEYLLLVGVAFSHHDHNVLFANDVV